MNKYFLYWVLLGIGGGVLLTFNGVNLFLFAAVFAIATILVSATWALGDCLADALQNMLGKALPPAVRFFTKVLVVYLTLCEGAVAVTFIRPQLAPFCLTVCLTGTALVAMLAFSIYALRAIMLKSVNR